MTLTRSAIPTAYRGTAFRSRLEARWAAFFDLVEWSWLYEPFDTPGWIPDFLIRGERRFLVEVGPCIDEAQYEGKAAKPLLYTELPTLVLGIGPLELGHDAGILVNEFPQQPGTGPAEWDDCAEHGLIIHGDDVLLPCGDAYGLKTLPARHLRYTATALERLWARAGNTVQWRP